MPVYTRHYHGFPPLSPTHPDVAAQLRFPGKRRVARAAREVCHVMRLARRPCALLPRLFLQTLNVLPHLQNSQSEQRRSPDQKQIKSKEGNFPPFHPDDEPVPSSGTANYIAPFFSSQCSVQHKSNTPIKTRIKVPLQTKKGRPMKSAKKSRKFSHSQT